MEDALAVHASDSLGIDDSKVLSRLVAHREAELSVLFTSTREHLKAMIATRLDSRLSSRVDSSDVVQEVYIRASRGLETFLKEPKVHPYVWLRLICKQIVAETHERHFRAKRSPIREAAGYVEHDLLLNFMIESSPSVHTQLEKEEKLHKIRERIASLPPLDREILEMRHTEGMSIQEISKTLEIQLDTAKKRYYRALDKFKNLISSDDSNFK